MTEETEPSANPADVQEQEQDLDGDLPEEGDAPAVPLDANEADVLEQSIEVPADDDEEPRV